MADLLALFISSTEEHSYACFTKVECKVPRRYSPDSGPSVQNWLDSAMAGHLGIRGSSTLGNLQPRHDSG
ncbi:hypothetical protein GW17_00046148 [Ensete ventricosum]|nr:hypothetical protein GW17_00046148 [Ensete ventricosum]